jgi:hypothetical protein
MVAEFLQTNTGWGKTGKEENKSRDTMDPYPS